MVDLHERPPALPNKPNVEFLNWFRKELASPMFQSRIPNFTKANLQDQWQRLSEIPELRNEFISALINRVGRVEVRSLAFDNPLARFERASMLYGSVYEEVQLGLPKANAYDPTRSYGEKELFGRHYPEAQSSFHTVSRQDQYVNTIDEAQLRRAFLSDEGLSPFVTQLMALPNEADKLDQFVLMTNLLHDAYKADAFFKVQVADLRGAAADSDDAKSALKAIRSMGDTLVYPSRRYNSAGMQVSSNRETLHLILTPEANATLDVDGLAALFNVERGQVPFQQTVIPYEFWPIPGAQAALVDESFFVVLTTYYDTGVMPNPAGRYTNYFLNHDQIVSLGRFANAVLFTTEPGTPIEIAPTPVQSITAPVITNVDGDTVTVLERGGVYMVEATVTTAPADGLNDAVRYEIQGNNSTRTRVWQTNTVVIARDETADSLKFIATATDTETPFIQSEAIFELVDPIITEFPPDVSIEPTGVTAGEPGAFTPADSRSPAGLEALRSLGALGETTAWTEDQYVVLRDGTFAYWDGNSWESGAAPA